jgi:orotate phosphoribosyltransferase-like protein
MEHNPVGLNVFEPEERQLVIRKALSLRLRGKSYADIGDELGVSQGQAWLYVTNELKRRAKETGETADEVIKMEVARLDKILEAIFPRVEEGSIDHIGALSFLVWMLRRNKKLR